MPVSSWFDDMSDSELHDLIPFLETLSKVDNVYTVLQNCNNPLNSLPPPPGPPRPMPISQKPQNANLSHQNNNQQQSSNQQSQNHDDYSDHNDGPS